MLLNVFWLVLVCALITGSLKIWRSHNTLAFRLEKMIAGLTGIVLPVGILINVLGPLAGSIVFVVFLSAIGFLYGMVGGMRNSG